MAKADLKKKVVLDIPTTEEEKKKALQSAIAHITKVYGGVTATVRRRLGPDIDAACGQLRRREMKEQG